MYSGVQFTTSNRPCNSNASASLGLLLYRRWDMRQSNGTQEHAIHKNVYPLHSLCSFSS